MTIKSLHFEQISDLFKTKRVELNYTQYEIASFLGYTNAQFISNFERGVSGLPLEKIEKLCELYKIPKVQLANIILEEQKRKLYKLWSIDIKKKTSK